MPRITPVTPENTDARTAASLKAVRTRLGRLPNLFTTLARSPAALGGYLQLAGALDHGRLSPRQRELIAIAVAQENACEYCLSAHAAIGEGSGLDEQDIEMARYGSAVDVTDDAIVKFALWVVRKRANVSDEVLEAARHAGLDDGLIIEIVATVALNTLTNYANRVAGTEIDFPPVSLPPAA